MSAKWLDAKQIRDDLKLYGSIHAVHRAVQRGELPPPTQFGHRHLWNEDRLSEFLRAREGDGRPAVPRKRKVVRVTT